jgi:hypothetical protein
MYKQSSMTEKNMLTVFLNLKAVKPSLSFCSPFFFEHLWPSFLLNKSFWLHLNVVKRPRSVLLKPVDGHVHVKCAVCSLLHSYCGSGSILSFQTLLERFLFTEAETIWSSLSFIVKSSRRKAIQLNLSFLAQMQESEWQSGSFDLQAT